MTIVVYSKDPKTCRACWATEKRLDDAGAEFVKVRIDDEDGAPILEELKSDGFLESPVVKIYDEHGEPVDAWSGYDPDKIDEYKHGRAA